MSDTHISLPGSFRALHPGARRVRDIDPGARVEVTLDLRFPPLPDASRLPAQALSYPELAAQYGAAQTDADTVAQVLIDQYGLTVDETSLGTHSMRVSGTAAQIEAAFQPNMGIYESADQPEYRGREGDIKIPAALS